MRWKQSEESDCRFLIVDFGIEIFHGPHYSSMSIHFKIVTPEKTVVEEEVFQITLPIEGGEITLLPMAA